jgi:hypothetical protein
MTILVVSLLLAIFVAMGYVIFNLSKKITLYEQTIQQFYEDTSIVLHTMRVLDEKQMFETDDEVGTLFQQLTDIIDVLRPLLYGTTDDKN